MSIDINDEIVQDFLIEAGEILEQLDENLVLLESQPEDEELLNSVFRSFHTIKGGAGFLAIDSLVDVCHQAENVFDVLRRGEQKISAELMDSILQSFDSINTMFEQIGDGVMPAKADPALIESLRLFANPGAQSQKDAVDESAVAGEESIVNETSNKKQEATENKAEAKGAVTPAADDEITEDEFEALLDELHGKGKDAEQKQDEPKEVKAVAEEPVTETKAVVEADARETPDEKKDPVQQATKANDENISEDEFEELLDVLQDEKKGAFSALDTRPKDAHGHDKKSAAEATVRVETGTLDRIMNMVGELVLLRNRLVNLDEEIGNEEMSSAVSTLDVVTADLQSSVMKTRMQPIKKVFGRFPRVVRDLARTLDKQVVLETSGEDTDLDKNLVEALTDPLIHLVRNAVDHGIEQPDVRAAAGKPKLGTIKLSAEQEGDHILLKISDDGAGMDANKLRAKVVESGLMDEDSAARLDDRECYNFILLPGFSTKDEISDISGRGVGMDVVKSKINQLNGTILLDSKPGKGTTISIKVPLTLAIMPTLMVGLGVTDQVFALPLVNVNEILDLDTQAMKIVDGQQILLVRNKPLPLFFLGRWLTKNAVDNGELTGHVVVVSVGTRNIGLLVDKLIGREEVVIKPLGALLHGTNGLTGATVTGNGKIALILDLPSLVQSYSVIR